MQALRGETMTERQKRHILEVLPIVAIVLAIAFFLLQCVSRKTAPLPQELQGDWLLNGAPVEVLPGRDSCIAGEETNISILLGEDFSASKVLCFYTAYEDVSVLLDGEVIYQLQGPESGVIQAAPNKWNIVSLPDGADGSLLEIVLSSPYQNYANRIPTIFYEDGGAITRYVLLKTIPPFIASLLILLIGFVFAIVAVILRYYSDQNTGLYSFSLFAMAVGIFLTMQQKTLLIWMHSGISYTFIQHLCFVLMPVLYTRYMTRVSRGLKKKLAICLHLISIFNFALILLLQLTRVRDFPEMMSSTRNLCIIIFVYVFIMEIKRQRKIMVLLLALLVGYTLLRYQLTGTITGLIYIGIYVYLIQMVYHVISNVVRAEARQIRLEAELEVSRSEIATIQITSHFFYHTLDSIRALIRLDADKAYKMTGDFSKYLRHRVDGVEGMQETIPFTRELRSIRAYTDIKKAQLGERFTMEFDLETEDFEILPLTVQPLVENAVIHAVQRRREGGLVRLVCREVKEGYEIKVIDNGPGAQVRVEKNEEEKRSTAIANVNKRLEFHGIAPLVYQKNELGGITVRLLNPKRIERKGKVE